MKIVILYLNILLIAPTFCVLSDNSQSTFHPLEGEFIIEPMTLKQKNCAMIRNVFDSLPTYAPVEGFFKSLLKPPVRNENKSYREIVLDIIQNYDFDPKNPEELQESQTIQAHINTLRETKTK